MPILRVYQQPVKFGTKGIALYPKILKRSDVGKLKAIKESIVIAENIKEIEDLLSEDV